MRIFVLAAAASMSLMPTLAMAQTGCPANAVLRDGVCMCIDGYLLAASGACTSAAASETIGAVEAGGAAGAAGLPVLGTIPAGAAVAVGGLVVLAGVAIGIAAAGGGDSSGTTTTSTTTTTPH